MRSATPMAIGVVTDFGASDSRVALLAPSTPPMAMADSAAVSEPTSSAPSSGMTRRLRRSSWA